jgi:hypothetical protein
MGQAKMDHGLRVVNLLRRLSKEIFDLDIDDAAAGRAHEFWALGIDGQRKNFRDLLRNVDLSVMNELNKRFHITDAGFEASAQNKLPLGGKRADIFLINVDHIRKADALIRPLLVHEICHYIEQIGVHGQYHYEPIDDVNARAVLDGLSFEVRNLHTMIWAKLLALAARKAAQLSSGMTVKRYLELAIPSYDRPRWNPSRVQEPNQVI